MESLGHRLRKPNLLPNLGVFWMTGDMARKWKLELPLTESLYFLLSGLLQKRHTSAKGKSENGEFTIVSNRSQKESWNFPDTQILSSPMWVVSIQSFCLFVFSQLLAPEIRHERNVILQCLRYIVRKNFLGVGQQADQILLRMYNTIVQVKVILSVIKNFFFWASLVTA